MKISIIKNLEIPDEVSNDFAFKYLKLLVKSQLHQIDVLTSLMNDELSDEEYLEKAKIIYNIELDESEKTIDIKEIRKTISTRAGNDREELANSLKEKLDYLKRWSKISSELTRKKLAIEEQVYGYCDILLDRFDKIKEKTQK